VHITRVTPDTVTVRSGPAITPAKPQRILDRVSSAFKKEPRGETLALPDGLGEDRPAERASGMPRLPVIMQGPPPSPPISEVEVVEDGEDSSSPSSSLESETAESGEPNTAALPPLAEATESDTPFQTPRPLDSPTMYTSNLTSEPFELAPSISGTGQAGAQSHLGVPAARQVSNSSTVSRAGSLAVVRCGRLAPQRDAGPSAGSRDAQAKAEDGWTFGKSREQAVLPDEDDGFPVPQSRKGSGGSLSRLSSLVAPLPSSVQPPRIFRRSTNPTSYPNPQRSPLVHSHSTFLPSPIMRSQTMVPGLDGAALDSDILLQSEAIRRERLERRQKRAGAKDNLLEGGEIRRKSEMKEPKKMEEARVLVGNLIGEDHVNYVLMYNMLTGIRIGVSLCRSRRVWWLMNKRYRDVRRRSSGL